VCVLVLSSYFVLDYARLKIENQALCSERRTETLRQRDMRSTILVQQEQVQQLSASVAMLETQLASAGQLVQRVRSLLRLEPAPAQSSAPLREAISYQGVTPEEPPWSEQVGAGVGGIHREQVQQKTGGAKLGMSLAASRSEEVSQMQAALPVLVKDLQAVSKEMQTRLNRLDTDEIGGAQEVEEQLRLQAAAPHDWPTENHFIISYFGYRILGGKEDFHTGVDFPVWYGTEVHATKEGSVSFAGWKEGYGWVVKVEHEMDFSTVYAHNASLLVEKGDVVQAGQVIALSGASGWTTGPHLHYEICIAGEPVDPIQYFDVGRPTP